jgi:DNA-binding CsgD family transcriptional regulator
MTFYWPIFRNHYFGVLFVGRQSGGLSGEAFLLAMIALLAVFAAFAACKSKSVHGWLASHPGVVPAVSLAAGLAAALHLAAPLEGAAARLALDIMLALVFSAHVTLVTAAWGMAVAQSQDMRVMFYLALSFFLSFVVSLSTQLPAPLNGLLPVAGPVACGFAWRLLPARAAAYKPFAPAVMSAMTMRTALVLLLFLLIGGVVRGFYASGVVNYAPTIEGLARPMMSIVLSLFLCVAVFFSAHKDRLINMIWVIFVLIYFAGLFITAGMFDSLLAIDADIVVMSRTFLGFFLWIALAGAARQHHSDPLFLLAALFLLTDCASGLLTNFAVPTLVATDPLFFQQSKGYLSLLMAFILLLGSFGYLTTLAFKYGASAGQKQSLADNDDGRKAACGRIASGSKLTAREADVLFLVSQGHSAKRIAESLFISVSTAQTHLKSLYRKTQSHSRQEIIDMVQAEIGKEA